MENQEKSNIVSLIKSEKERFGSYNRLSRVCNVSNATISNMINENWESISDEIWQTVGNVVGYRASWTIAETFNIKQMFSVMNTARSTRSFWAVSHRAGSGKTASIKLFAQLNTQGVYSIQAQEWTQRQFLVALCNKLGIEITGAYKSIAALLELVCDFFVKRNAENPILLIDEADKLKDGAKRMLIPLYNKLEDKLACVIAGTDNLEIEIKRGVRHAKKGFDEIDSRFGRTYFKLAGATFKDIEMICKANGVSDIVVIKRIFHQAGPVNSVQSGVSTKIIDDIRPIKNLIRAEKALQKELNLQSVENS